MAIFLGDWVWNGCPARLPGHVLLGRSHPPTPFQQNAIKYGPGRGRGRIDTGNRTVTLSLQVFPLLEGGNAVRFFHFVFFVSGSASFVVFFTVLLFLGSLFENFFGSELLFYGVGVGLVCFGAVLPMLLLYYSFFRSRNCLEKILLMSGLVFSGCLPSSFGFFADVVVLVFCFCLFSFKRESLGSNRAHPHTHLVLFVLVLFVVPPRLSVHPFWPCVLLLGVSLLGCHSGPHAFLGFSWYSSEALFLDARRQGCFWSFLSFVFVFPFCCVLRLFSHQLEGADPSSYVAHPRVVVPAPRPSEGPGAPSSATGWPRS